MIRKKIIVAISGASGSIYAKLLLDKLSFLSAQFESVVVLISDVAASIWKHELGNNNYTEYPFQYYDINDFNSPIASGSSKYDTMIICPCSMGTIGRISAGISENLIGRAADVILKEKQQLIVVPREMPFSLIHLTNLKKLAESGATIMPASPSFYNKPGNVNDVSQTVVDRIIDHLGLEHNTFRWGQNN